METSKQSKFARNIAATAILVPLALMFIDFLIGDGLFFFGVIIAIRILAYSRYLDDEDPVNKAEQRKLDRHQINSRNTILVQIADDKKRDLPMVLLSN